LKNFLVFNKRALTAVHQKVGGGGTGFLKSERF